MTDWHGCYGDSWQGVIVPEAFAHPAKFSRGLIRRIYEHLLACGYVAPGDSVIDPFGGVAHPRRRQRKSFFRLLAEKNGAPPIDHEDVIILRKR